MIRAKDIQKIKKDTNHFKKQIKIAQERLYRSWDIARTAPLDENIHGILEQKERHFRTMKKRLAGMEANLRALQESNQEPEKLKAWKIRRPANESRLIQFCEA